MWMHVVVGFHQPDHALIMKFRCSVWESGYRIGAAAAAETTATTNGKHQHAETRMNVQNKISALCVINVDMMVRPKERKEITRYMQLWIKEKDEAGEKKIPRMNGRYIAVQQHRLPERTEEIFFLCVHFRFYFRFVGSMYRSAIPVDSTNWKSKQCVRISTAVVVL